ncbi:unnamed protein product [Mytilus edulis]|uniref:DDE Tnp4 domain-containing protein n=1 Tax=Mytilus edulis TaxID=6550 RepID=A0A8S3UFB4_MYTED|nr:unnamed protein product [Mytilus edulis]
MAENLKVLAALEDSDELLLLSLCKEEKGNFPGIEVEKLTNEQCRSFFRFDKDDIEILRRALRIPEKVVCSNRTTARGIDGLCMVLRRLAYPCRLEDLEYIFGRSKTELSLIINEVLDYIHDNHCHLLSDFNMSWLSQECLERFAGAVFDRDGPLDSCWGFIDGTVRPICRPQENQRLVFNGHKRSHALKFQSIVTPNGIISNLFGPIEGRRHDAGMLRESDILAQMRVHMTTPQGRIFCIYGDPAYPVTDGYIIAPFRGGVISRNQMIFNKRMSAVRICVEWAFGKVLSLFAFLDYKKNLKLYLQPVGKYYKVAVLLTNCHTCLYGSETGIFFDVSPPTLEEYLLG